ncbi:MAG: adenylate cyclase [Gammaproteobacteria bacterium]|nr:MAG: adenylate cyclase [Pseudomonadota bacterium]PIE38345.1 MAG: adenylate cyclase [Gammaproteobacteria bacterium]
MNYLAKNKAITLNFEDGVDRKLLKAVERRFLELNSTRLERTKLALSARQEIVLELLPLLFHVNHPLLPGYVSRACPHKVARYEPSKETLSAAQRYNKTFKYTREPRHRCDIVSLFLMGSTGSIAQREGSDLDIWLCIRDGLSSAQVNDLEKKANLISGWANERGLEVHFFTMNAKSFKEGRSQALIDEEDCGSAQHFLLLDEFYRTSIFLTGCYPLWWLIPVELESHYDKWAAWLIDNRFIKQGKYIDFGGISRIPKGEFVGAGMWQLYKAIDSPYKSVLKLLLNEVYAVELPELDNLSLEFKQALYSGQYDSIDMDSYVMIYRRLERYLKSRDKESRLTLVRKCFYLKVGERLTRTGSAGNLSWRFQAMSRLVEEWQWGESELAYLDERHRWKVPQVQSERKVIVSELTHCYRFLSGFTRSNRLKAAINTEDMSLLGRKLYAAFQRKAGKLDFINPKIAPSLAEESLAFHHASSLEATEKTGGWLLYRDLPSPIDAPFYPSLKRSNSLVELVVWCHYNGLLDRSTRMGLLPGKTGVSMHELKSIVNSVKASIPLPLPAVSQDAFRVQGYPLTILLFVNVGLDPLKRYVEKGLHKVSNRNDSLGYSENRQNLVITLDQVTVNSWNEVMVNRYELGDTLVQCLKNYLAQLVALAEGKKPPQIHVYCFDQSRSMAISSRVAELFDDVQSAFFGDRGNLDSRYIIELDQRFFIIQFFDKQPRFTGSDTVFELFDYLSMPQKQRTRLVLDRYAFQEKPRFRAVVDAIGAEGIQVFYYAREETAEVYLVDEKGSFFTYTTPFYTESALLTPLSRFLLSVLERRQMRADLADIWSDIEIRFYRLDKDRLHNRFQCTRVDPDRLDARQNYFDVQAIGSIAPEGELSFDIFCDQKEFAFMEYGEQLIPAVARYILSRRASGSRYPCYITDLALPHDLNRQEYQTRLQTIQYVKHKYELESALNTAIRDFS